MAKSARNRRTMLTATTNATGTQSIQNKDPSCDLREKIEQIIPPDIGASQRGEVVNRVIQVATSFSGPIPHSSELARYERICPGLADRIMKMAENAHDKQENRKDKILECEYRDRRRGMWLGFSALFLFIASGVVISLFSSLYLGGTLLSTAVVGTTISSFIEGRKKIPSAAIKPTKKSPAKS